MSETRRRLLVNGIVQGVGFRPFIYNLGLAEGVAGFVTNTSAGVIIEIQGPTAALDLFMEKLRDQAPPLSIIVSVDATDIPIVDDEKTFVIKASENAPGTHTLIPPDVATCADCLAEIRNPDDRRHGYPFTNCTNCGPRWTIIGRIPYDRPYTSMAKFTMCPVCQAEYDDPQNRRFHAQPNACPECGPRVWLVDKNDEDRQGDGLTEAAARLAAGSIGAIKGLGGFHLAVRADDDAAVARLRRRKHREAKPLAIMVRDLEAARALAFINDADAKHLTSVQAPIVLVATRKDAPLAVSVAPDHRRLGLMLPYTPLHHLLFDQLNRLGVSALIMTSGNASDEPICLDNTEAVDRLADIADWWLLHDRDILRRADDSVMQVLDQTPHFYRRSRGFAPVPVFVDPADADVPILAVGPELKNTICLLKEDRAFLSPHIGDLENLKAFEFFRETITTLQDVLECEPAVIAHDLHPGYFSTQWAREQAAGGKNLVAVQHHHAHLVAVQAEHKITGPTVGLILDGTGYGTDGTIWGGEILVGDASGFERAGHFQPVPLPGGDAAIKAPWRTAVSYLRLAGLADQDIQALPFLAGQPVAQVLQMLEKSINSPLTSSCGRLFDAVAAATGRWSQVNYEAQAAIELMALTTADDVSQASPFAVALAEDAPRGAFLAPLVLPTADIVKHVVQALAEGATAEEISARFHNTLLTLLTDMAVKVCKHKALDQVVLAGGVLQNEILMAGLMKNLTDVGLQPIRPSQTPANDGAIALGQAIIARKMASPA